MILINLIIGSVIIIYAVVMFVLRTFGDGKQVKKLEPMKEKYGERTGSAIHFFAYVAVPLIFGLLIIYLGIIGISIFDIF